MTAACSLEDRIALEDHTIAYAHAVDSMQDIDSITACFTPDCEFDLRGIGMARMSGHEGVREFYTAAFAGNDHFAHYLSNFAVTGYDGATASLRTYVMAFGRGKDGSSIAVQGRYYFDAVRTDSGWRFARYWMDFLIPPG